MLAQGKVMRRTRGAGAWQAARHESVGISSMFMAMPVKKQGEKHQDKVGSQFLVCR